jgi:hypothetical protein
VEVVRAHAAVVRTHWLIPYHVTTLYLRLKVELITKIIIKRCARTVIQRKEITKSHDHSK